MNIVLMDTRRHKTIRLSHTTLDVILPVWTLDDGIQTAVFRWNGDFLFGDPIYYQIRGPEIPDQWWGFVPTVVHANRAYLQL